MCVYMYVCMFMYVYLVYVSTSIFDVSMYVCMYVCMYVFVNVCSVLIVEPKRRDPLESKLNGIALLIMLLPPLLYYVVDS